MFVFGALFYLPVIVALRAFMRNRKPFVLKSFLFYWNMFLAILSVFMLGGMVPYAINLYSTYSWNDAICMNRHYGRYYWSSMALEVMLWSKLFELVDTVLLALRKKPIILLHWYHHITVLLFTWCAHVATHTNVHVVYTTMNCFVHSLMYTYYAMASIRIFFPFPQILTVLQIAQMVVGAVVAYQSGNCPEHAIHWWSGVLMYLSYFALFFNFFLTKYAKKPDARFTLRETPQQKKN